MRYADCPTVSVSVVVDAPPSVVWPLVTDINLPARFSSEFLGATWVEEGKSFVGRNAAIPADGSKSLLDDEAATPSAEPLGGELLALVSDQVAGRGASILDDAIERSIR